MFDALLVTTPRERSILARTGDVGRVRVVPTPIELGPGPDADAVREGIVFVGGLDYEPNVRGVSWFAWEGDADRQADPPRREALHHRPRPLPIHTCPRGLPGVDLVGPVADAVLFVDRAAVSVAPLPLAPGGQLKILEAMAAGAAVVVTTAAAEGVGGRHGQHLSVADTEDAFAHAVVDLLGLIAPMVAGTGRPGPRQDRFSPATFKASIDACLAEVSAGVMR